MDRFIYWSLCAVLVLLPLPFGGTREWAVFIFEGVTAALLALHLVQEWKPSASPREKIPLPRFLKILALVYFTVSVVQLIPLPSSLVRLIAPGTAAVWDASLGAGAGGIAASRTLTFSLVPALSSDELVKWAFFALFAWLVFKHIRTKKNVEFFVLVLIIGGALQSLYGLAEVFGGTEKIFGTKKVYYLGSATGTFINRDHFSGFLEMIFPLSLGFLLAKADFFRFKRGLTFKEKILWFSQERLQKSVVFGLIPVVTGLGIVFSRSRAGVFILFLTIFLMLALLTASGRGRESASAGERGKRFAFLLRTVSALVIFSAVLIGIRPVIERFSWSQIEKESRPEFYKNTVEIIKHYPFLGTGPGTFRYVYPQYEKSSSSGLVDHAHNDYLEVLAESGIVAGGCLILIALAAVAFLFSGWAKRQDSMIQGILLGVILGIIALLVHSLIDFNLRITANAVYFMTLYALGLRLIIMSRNRSGRPTGPTSEIDIRPEA